MREMSEKLKALQADLEAAQVQAEADRLEAQTAIACLCTCEEKVAKLQGELKSCKENGAAATAPAWEPKKPVAKVAAQRPVKVGRWGSKRAQEEKQRLLDDCT